MHTDSILDWAFLLALIFGPAVLGLLALGVGIHQLRKGRRDPEKAPDATPLAVFCFIVAFGITACYGLLFLNP
jgi:hypothetical protein